MSGAFYGEIRMFGPVWAPRDWALCNGQILAINQFAEVFSLIGTSYGGDGRVSFALPDMRGRIPIGQGRGPGLTHRTMGEKLGLEAVRLDISQIPNHTHKVQVSGNDASTTTFSDNVLAKQTCYQDQTNAAVSGTMAEGTIGQGGGSEYHVNIMPALAITFIICMKGVYPERN